jgi:hypothetical protein
MTTQLLETRWIAPPGLDVHPHFALVRHDGRLFSFAALTRLLSPDAVKPPSETIGLTPQEVWDDIAARLPDVAVRTAAKCQSLDNDILDLYAIAAQGCA